MPKTLEDSSYFDHLLRSQLRWSLQEQSMHPLDNCTLLPIQSHSTNIQTFSDVIPPRLLPNFQDAIQWSLPLVQRSFTDIFTSFLTI